MFTQGLNENRKDEIIQYSVKFGFETLKELIKGESFYNAELDAVNRDLNDISKALAGNPLYDLVNLNCSLSAKYNENLEPYREKGYLVSIPRAVLESYSLEEKKNALWCVGYYINLSGCKKGISRLFKAMRKAAIETVKDYAEDKIEEYALGLIFDNEETIDDVKRLISIVKGGIDLVNVVGEAVAE